MFVSVLSLSLFLVFVSLSLSLTWSHLLRDLDGNGKISSLGSLLFELWHVWVNA